MYIFSERSHEFEPDPVQLKSITGLEDGLLIQARNLSILVLLCDAVSTSLAPLAQSLGLQRVGEMPLMTYTLAHMLAQLGDYHCERVESEPALQEANRVATAEGRSSKRVRARAGSIFLLTAEAVHTNMG